VRAGRSALNPGSVTARNQDVPIAFTPAPTTEKRSGEFLFSLAEMGKLGENGLMSNTSSNRLMSVEEALDWFAATREETA
jgi:hypothetical protein